MSALLEFMRTHKEDRGVMANLRCALVDSKRYRAWPILGRFAAIGDPVAETVAGLFATHPEEDLVGNLGTTCLRLMRVREGTHRGESGVTPTERRFQYLLAAEKTEISERVVRIILMAKVNGIPINYERLERDLRYWNDRIRTEWASAFWVAERQETGDSK